MVPLESFGSLEFLRVPRDYLDFFGLLKDFLDSLWSLKDFWVPQGFLGFLRIP